MKKWSRQQINLFEIIAKTHLIKWIFDKRNSMQKKDKKFNVSVKILILKKI